MVSAPLQADSTLISQSFLNAALFCDDCLSNKYLSNLLFYCDQLKCQLIRAPHDCSTIYGIGYLFDGDFSDFLSQKLSTSGVVLISPNPYSLYTICVYKLLKLFGIPVNAVVIRRFLILVFALNGAVMACVC